MSEEKKDPKKTAAYWLEAVKENPCYFHDVPTESRTAEVCYEAMSKSFKSGRLNIPPKQGIETVEFWIDTVKQESYAFKYVPEKLKTAEVCFEAMGRAFKARGLNIPPKQGIETVKFWLAVVKKGGFALEYVPKEFKTAEVCLAAVKKGGRALGYVPEEHKTAELCLEAVKKDDQALEFIPEGLKTAELCLEAFTSGTHPSYMLLRVPKEIRTAEFCFEAMGRAFKDLGLNLPAKRGIKTMEVWLNAVKQSDIAFEYVPEELETAEFYREAVKQNPQALCHVPEKYLTPELLEEVTMQEGFFK